MYAPGVTAAAARAEAFILIPGGTETLVAAFGLEMRTTL
jgi:hypothetical protein